VCVWYAADRRLTPFAATKLLYYWGRLGVEYGILDSREQEVLVGVLRCATTPAAPTPAPTPTPAATAVAGTEAEKHPPALRNGAAAVPRKEAAGSPDAIRGPTRDLFEALGGVVRMRMALPADVWVNVQVRPM
jgi:hypothetical protein